MESGLMAYYLKPEQLASRNRIKANSRKEIFIVENEFVGYEKIASRLGLTIEQARRRMSRERAKPGNITWEGLQR